MQLFHSSDKVLVERTSLVLAKGLKYALWQEVGRRIGRYASAASWWQGDWLIYGETNFRYRYREAIEVTGLDYQTLRNYAWVASRFEPARRNANLSFQHHAEVAAMDEAEQDRWLALAEASSWSRNELRKQIRMERVGESPAAEDIVTILHIRASRERERHWREAARHADLPLSEWIAATLDDAAKVALFDSGDDLPVPSRSVVGSATAA